MVATLILSAGLGTRLAPLSSWRPKPLVPVGDRPAVLHIVERVRRMSRVVVLNAHHRADDVAALCRSEGLALSREAHLLGTAGGLEHAAGLLGDGDVLVWNGDMIGDLDVAALLEAHRREAGRGAVATLVVRPRREGGGVAHGNTGLDAHGAVVRLRREPAVAAEASTADFLGVYVVGDSIRRSLPTSGDIIAEAFLPALRAGARVAAFAFEGAMIDVGTPRAYLDANLAWLARRGAVSWLGPGARVSSTGALDGVVVGAGATVVGEGIVERCVVWPGGVLHAPMADAIVAPEGVVSLSVTR